MKKQLNVCKNTYEIDGSVYVAVRVSSPPPTLKEQEFLEKSDTGSICLEMIACITQDAANAMELGEKYFPDLKTGKDDIRQLMSRSFKLSMANLTDFKDMNNKNVLQWRREKFLPRNVLRTFCQMMAVKN